MEHLEQLRQSGLFEARVPRYTSFPPVSRFAPSEGKLHNKDWLNAIPSGASLSLYVHVPYCVRKCWFCVCRTQVIENLQVLEAYVDVLLKEISLVRKQLPDDVTLARLHLGGGTPTLLSPQKMRALLKAIYDRFPISSGFECSVEVDATQVETGLIDTMLEEGMTRAVVGVQDFEPCVQDEIGRQQSFEETLNVVRDLRQSGLKHLDMEVLFGLPAQTAASVAETAQQVVALEPDRVSVCEYAHKPDLVKRQFLLDARKLPKPEYAFLMSQIGRQILMADGYETIGIDHFVRPGDPLIDARKRATLRRDFLGYSDDATHALIGLGASAISRFPQGYTQNCSATSTYLKTIREDQLASNRGYKLTGYDVVIAGMIEMLMCRFEIDIQSITEKFPTSIDIIESSIDGLVQVFGPYVDVSSDKLSIKPSAQPLARLMSNLLDQLAGNDVVGRAAQDWS